MKIVVLFVGEVHDAGFNASALAGAEAAAASGSAQIEIASGIPYDQQAILAALRRLAPTTDGLVFVGGQGDRSTPLVAGEFPDKRFAVVQGQCTGPNLASYAVRQEDSAFLAGCLAARLTRTGTVAHLSGHRVKPGLKGRAAFAGGVAHADPEVNLLTSFCGTQDDNAITRAWASAQMARGADIVFTMLNAARQGVIDACLAHGTRQIGNALDWCATHPEVFVASAVARIDLGVRRAIDDLLAGITPPTVVEFGLADGDYVALTVNADVPPAVVAEVEATAAAIRAGEIEIPTCFEGVEFEPGNERCSPGA